MSGLLFDPAGNLLSSAFANNRLIKLSPPGWNVSAVAGNGNLRSSGDGGPGGDAGISVSYCFAYDGNGNLFVCDSSYRIRKIDARTGVISTVAGHGKRGYGGDGGSALDAEFGVLVSLAIDRSDNLYVADDTSNRIRRIDAATGIISTIAGSAPPAPCCSTFINFVPFEGEGGPATEAHFNSPRSLVFNREGNLVFAINGRVCEIDRQGYLRTIAGNGHDGYAGDGKPATSARISPSALAIDPQGNLLIADFGHNRIRKVDAKTGRINTIAGNGLPHRPPQAIM